jgi:hypothetical protein
MACASIPSYHTGSAIAVGGGREDQSSQMMAIWGLNKGSPHSPFGYYCTVIFMFLFFFTVKKANGRSCCYYTYFISMTSYYSTVLQSTAAQHGLFSVDEVAVSQI